MRKYDFISALEKETAAEVVKNREEWMKYLITAVSFLITDFSRSKSLYQMIGFVRTVFPAVVEGIFEVISCDFWRTGIRGNKHFFIGLFGVADVVYRFINGCFDSMDFCVRHTLFINSFTSFISS